jgi:hypothetical protein
MIIKNKKLLAWVISFAFILPFLTYADKYTFNGLLPSVCTGDTPDQCNFEAIMATINHALNWIVSMAGVIATITFAIAGAQMLFNPDNPGKRADAVEMFKKTAIGLIIVLAAWLLMTTAIKFLLEDWSSALKFFNI